MRVYIGPYGKGARIESVKIDDYDVWSLDNTLAKIIHPALILLKEKKHGSPDVDDEDVPEHLRSTSASPKENEWDTDEHWHSRWDWVMDEMIWAFGEELKDWEDQFYSGHTDMQWDPIKFEHEGKTELLYEMRRGPKDTFKFDKEGYDTHYARMKNGFRLFGKYYNGLWD